MKTKLALPLPEPLYAGLQLVPIEPGRIGNAIITSVNDKKNKILVVTDFGNELKLTKEEVSDLFFASKNQADDQYFHELVGVPYDPATRLRSRFERQKELIDTQLSDLP